MISVYVCRCGEFAMQYTSNEHSNIPGKYKRLQNDYKESSRIGAVVVVVVDVVAILVVCVTSS